MASKAAEVFVYGKEDVLQDIFRVFGTIKKSTNEPHQSGLMSQNKLLKYAGIPFTELRNENAITVLILDETHA